MLTLPVRAEQNIEELHNRSEISFDTVKITPSVRHHQQTLS